MRDRVSTKILDNGATRYGVYDEEGKLLRYEYIKLEDEPSTEGDFFNKANMLPDSITAMLGLKMENPQVKDALNVLANAGNLHVWERVQSGVTDYLTSTDRNAYPDNVMGAQDAYYTLGDVVTGKFGMGMRYASTVFEYSVASEISASDDGTISLKDPTTFTIGSSSGYPGVAGNVTAAIAGKYIQLKVMGSATSLMSGPFSSAPSPVVYIPSDAIATREDITNGNTQTWYFVDRYQPVIGHAAIPANTTITYLGQLGGGARIEVGSYVGTGNFSVSINVNKNAKFIVISSGYIIGFFVPTDDTFSSFKVNSRYFDYYTSFNAKMTNGTLSWSGSQQNNYSDELYLCSSGVTFYIFTIC